MTTGREYRFQVRSYECGPDGAATLPTICNYLQEAASLNAESLSFSKSNFAAAGENIFRSETLAGEEVRAEGVEVEPGVYVHRISAPDGRDHVLARTRWSARTKVG